MREILEEEFYKIMTLEPGKLGRAGIDVRELMRIYGWSFAANILEAYGDKYIDCVKRALKDNKLPIRVVPESIRKKIPEICMEKFEECRTNICYVPEEFVTKEMIEKLTEKEWESLYENGRWSNMPKYVFNSLYKEGDLPLKKDIDTKRYMKEGEYEDVYGEQLTFRGYGAARISKQIADEHPELVEGILHQAMDMLDERYIYESLPEEIANQTECLCDELRTARKVNSRKIEAKKLLRELEAELNWRKIDMANDYERLVKGTVKRGEEDAPGL